MAGLMEKHFTSNAERILRIYKYVGHDQDKEILLLKLDQ